MRRPFTILVVFTLLAIHISCKQPVDLRGVPASQPAAVVVVSIDNFAFSPMNLQIAVGTRVTWKNADDVPHTVTSRDSLFDSGAIDTDEQFSFTFTRPGVYPYYCKVHPHMSGVVTVK